MTDRAVGSARHHDSAVSIDGATEDRYLRLLSGAYLKQQAASVRILREHKGAGAIRHLARDAHSRAHRCAGAGLRITPPSEPLACGKGCYHCCWATVGVVAPDAIYMADELRSRLPEDEFSALVERSARLARRLQRMDRREKLAARLPCSLLKDGACSSYEHRPLVCRWACAPSLQACHDHLVHRTTSFLEMEGVRYQPTQEVWRGLRAGLWEVGLDASLLSLNGALAIALADPDIAHRYLAGEDVFADARLE
ncbi:MAG TPA: YkgJ family cysteine cluster protein [Chloroflexota bacterium]|nr:YkgJ family cysteine cluster protein [Chloroflexota bacterium]HEX2987063.1 YkgJ family cysteine cluster protein [Chloroflexota bacterium]